MYGIDNVEFVESAEDSSNENESFEDISIEDKIEEIWQYYECAGFDFKTEEDFWRFLGI